MPRKKRSKKSLAGFWLLESIVVIGFAALLFNARAIREASSQRIESEPDQRITALDSTEMEAAGWESHRPRFSHVVGDLWNGGF